MSPVEKKRPRASNGRFAEGQPPPERPVRRTKGTPNKITRDLKQGILGAAISVGRDGKGKGGLKGYLQHLAIYHPKCFSQLLGKLLPLSLTAEDGAAITAIGNINLVAVPSDHYLSAEAVRALNPLPPAIEAPPATEGPPATDDGPAPPDNVTDVDMSKVAHLRPCMPRGR